MADKHTVYTEQGFSAAEEQWDTDYHARLDHCRNTYPPATPEATACFGKWYEADEHVDTVVRAVVGMLRGYWIARAAGEKPDWAKTHAQIVAALLDLPPLSRAYFDRIQGL